MMRVMSESSYAGLGLRQAQQQKSNANAVLYPCNPSLQDELNRLFLNYCLGQCNVWPQVDEVREEFKHNGRDYEYCSDTEEQVITPRTSKKKNKKPLPTECVFCKNNGEDVKIYKKHVLKSPEGRVECPILRKYVCPICSATGDDAHTIKYCPNNKKQQMQPLASMNTLKALRNSTGRRRSK